MGARLLAVGIIVSPAGCVAFGSFPSDYIDSQVEVCQSDQMMGSPHFQLRWLPGKGILSDQKMRSWTGR